MNKLFLRHLILTAALLVVTVTVFSLTPLDMLVQNTLYNGSTHQWLMDKQEPWARLFFYDGIKAALFVLFMLLSSTLLLSRFKPSLKPLRAGLLIVILSMILVPSSVSMLKATTNMAWQVYRQFDVPRDLLEFFVRPRVPGDTAFTPVPPLVTSSIDLSPEKAEQ